MHKSGAVQVKMAVGRPAHGRLSVVRAQLSAQTGRYVTYSEALEVLLDHYEATSKLLADVEEAARWNA